MAPKCTSPSWSWLVLGMPPVALAVMHLFKHSSLSSYAESVLNVMTAGFHCVCIALASARGDTMAC